MRANVRAFVELAASAFGLRGPVYEFGSYQVEGQADVADLRPLFAGQRYIGCDMRAGPGVDRVEDLAELTLPDESAQTIICVDTLEHVFEARRAVAEMLRVLAPGGTILLAAPLDFRIHDYPSDYWRLTPSCLERLLSPVEATLVGWQGCDAFPHAVFGIGCKAPVCPRFVEVAGRFMQAFQDWLRDSAAATSWDRRARQWFAGLLASKGERRRLRSLHQARFAIHLPVSREWKQELLGLSPASTATGARVDLV